MGKRNAAPLLSLSGHDGPVNSVAFSSTSPTLASGADDRTIRLWNLDRPNDTPVILREQTGTNEQPGVIGHSDDVNGVRFSKDGKTLISAGADLHALLWMIDTETLANEVCQKVWQNLSLADWKEFVGSDVAYECTCPDLAAGPGAPRGARNCPTLPPPEAP